jgi:two-component system, OmpR family, KDP operon response regulator KdpE
VTPVPLGHSDTDSTAPLVLTKRPAVLVCDDHSPTVSRLRIVLRHAGYDVFRTRTATEALYHARLRALDAVITEVVLPDGGGVALCRRLRESSDVAVLMLSTVAAEEQKLQAFAAGADDYLTKPFPPRELIARLHAVLRRVRGSEDEPPLRVDGLTIDFAARLVYRNGDRVDLTPTEFALLRALATNRGCLMSHMELFRNAWGTEHGRDRRALRVHMCHLRRKLGGPGRRPLIHTHPGVGYRFDEPALKRVTRGISLRESETSSQSGAAAA